MVELFIVGQVAVSGSDAQKHEFDRQISRDCRHAANQAKITYGRFDGKGFTLHSLRDTTLRTCSLTELMRLPLWNTPATKAIRAFPSICTRRTWERSSRA
ncbi:MAG TPA: hypothetical protein VES69_14995 [Pyrinomonadaceae bacterium]|nr:hypothetical protein [Pyrinomonadaceae bacterium]